MPDSDEHTTLFVPGLFKRLVVSVVLPAPVCVLLLSATRTLRRDLGTSEFADQVVSVVPVAMLIVSLPSLAYAALMERVHTLGAPLGHHLLVSVAAGLLVGALFYGVAGSMPAIGAVTGLVVGLVLWPLRASAEQRRLARLPW